MIRSARLTIASSSTPPVKNTHRQRMRIRDRALGLVGREQRRRQRLAERAEPLGLGLPATRARPRRSAAARRASWRRPSSARSLVGTRAASGPGFGRSPEGPGRGPATSAGRSRWRVRAAPRARAATAAQSSDSADSGGRVRLALDDGPEMRPVIERADVWWKPSVASGCRSLRIDHRRPGRAAHRPGPWRWPSRPAPGSRAPRPVGPSARR